MFKIRETLMALWATIVTIGILGAAFLWWELKDYEEPFAYCHFCGKWTNDAVWFKKNWVCWDCWSGLNLFYVDNYKVAEIQIEELHVDKLETGEKCRSLRVKKSC